jgi:hypothetical protein
LKILLVGVFTRGSTDNWKALALRRLGHRVFPFEYREQDWRNFHPLGEPWDLVFVSKGVPLPVEAFERLASISKARLLWWPDPFENWTPELTEAVRAGWRVSATSTAVLVKILAAAATSKHLRSHPMVDGSGLRAEYELSMPPADRVARILEGCDCEGPRPDWAPKEIRPALLHFGHLSERRVAIIERLRASGIAVDHLEEPLFGAALQRKVLEYAAVLGINSSPDLYSSRVTTVLAMGGRILAENAPGLAEDFDALSIDGHHHWPLRIWSNEEECVRFAREPVMLDPVGTRLSDLARCVHEDFSWENAMRRALAFACPQEVPA